MNSPKKLPFRSVTAAVVLTRGVADSGGMIAACTESTVLNEIAVANAVSVAACKERIWLRLLAGDRVCNVHLGGQRRFHCIMRTPLEDAAFTPA